MYWHSELFKDKNYHLNKLKLANSKGIKLINIFEDEWQYKKDIVKSRLLNLIGENTNKIYGRDCQIKEIKESRIVSEFLDQNHIQGKVGSKVKLGLYYNDQLVSLMTFGDLRVNMGGVKKENHYELLRFCNKLNTTVIGGASKLLSYFYKNFKCEELTSYADLRWSEGKIYEILGFNKISESSPNYFYTKGDKRHNRYSFRKSELIKRGEDSSKTEKEIMKTNGYFRIYDCGNIKFKKV